MEGRSLRPAADGRDAARRRPAYAESLHSQLQYGWAPLHAWRTAQHKLIEAPRVELYDLAADPAEAHDLSAREAARVEGMRRELQRAMATTTPSAAQAVDAETARAAGARSATSGTGPEATAPPPSGRDPKDGIGSRHRGSAATA